MYTSGELLDRVLVGGGSASESIFCTSDSCAIMQFVLSCITACMWSVAGEYFVLHFTTGALSAVALWGVPFYTEVSKNLYLIILCIST